MKCKSLLAILILSILIFNPSYAGADNHTYTVKEKQMTVFDRDDLSKIHNEVVIEEKELVKWEPYKTVPRKVSSDTFIQYEYTEKNIVEYNFAKVEKTDFKIDHKLSDDEYLFLKDNYLYSEINYRYRLPTVDGYIGVNHFQKESIWNLSISYDRIDVFNSKIENHYINVTEVMNLEDAPVVDPISGWNFSYAFNNQELRYIDDGWLAYYFTFVNDTAGYIRYENGTMLGYNDNFENWVILHNLFDQSTQYLKFPLRTTSSDLPTHQTFPLPDDIIFSQDLNTIIGFHGDNYNRIYVYDGDNVESIDLPGEINQYRKHFEDFSRNELLLGVQGELFVFNIETNKLNQIAIGKEYKSAFTDDYIIVIHGYDTFAFLYGVNDLVWLGLIVLVPISYFLYSKYKLKKLKAQYDQGTKSIFERLQ